MSGCQKVEKATQEWDVESASLLGVVLETPLRLIVLATAAVTSKRPRRDRPRFGGTRLLLGYSLVDENVCLRWIPLSSN